MSGMRPCVNARRWYTWPSINRDTHDDISMTLEYILYRKRNSFFHVLRT